MKKSYRLILVLLLLCLQNNSVTAANKTHGVVNNTTVAARFTVAADTSYLGSLSIFKKALAAGDKATAKTFFSFPVMTENNSIWHLAYAENEKLLVQLPDGPKPFTEKDFDNYFDQLFPKNFKAGLQQLNLATLRKKGAAETTSFRQSPSTTCKLYASFDSTENTITFSLGFHTLVKNKKGAVEDAEEYGTQYVFAIIKGGHLQFKRIQFSA